MIDILIPVLARPQNVAPLVESIRSATKHPHTILFLCSKGDEAQIQACRETTALTEVVPWSAGRSDYPKKMNYGLAMTRGEFILLGADDLSFQSGWDDIALEVARRTKACVIGTNDCANSQVKRGFFSTHALVRRSYAEERGASLDGPGTLVSEAYDHNYCDRELCHLAKSRGLWAFAARSHIKHHHPIWRTAPDDQTYAKGKTTFKQDHMLFYERAEQWEYVGILPQERGWVRKLQLQKQGKYKRARR